MFIVASRSFFYQATKAVLQVACLLLDDAVPNRVHWPRQAELRINAMVYRPYGRNSNTKLGGNARDEPANAAHRCTVGRNRVSLNCVEDRPFCELPAALCSCGLLVLPAATCLLFSRLLFALLLLILPN